MAVHPSLDLRDLSRLFDKHKHSLYIVGGYIRNVFLNRKSHDIDLATSASPHEVVSILEEAHLPIIPIGIEFGTVATIIKGFQVEITTFRCAESYKKGSRKPQVQFGKSIHGDLFRRDFTANAVAMNLKDMRIIDPFGGIEDIRRGKIKTPADPDISFQDDPLRLLRACRFVADMPKGAIEEETLTSMISNAALIKEVSDERIFSEITKILMTNNVKGLKTMGATGLLAHTLPAIDHLRNFTKPQGIYHSKDIWEHTLGVVENVPIVEELKWSALFHDVGKPETYEESDSGIHFYGHEKAGERIWRDAAEHLKISNEFTEHVAYLIREHLVPSLLSDGFNLEKETPHASNRTIRRFIRRAGSKTKIDNLLILSAADITSHKEETVKAKLEKLNVLIDQIEKIFFEGDIVKMKLPKNTGDKVMKLLGLEPGPKVGKVMKRLEEMMVEGLFKQEEIDTEIPDDGIYAALYVERPEDITEEDIERAKKWWKEIHGKDEQ